MVKKMRKKRNKKMPRGKQINLTKTKKRIKKITEREASMNILLTSRRNSSPASNNFMAWTKR